MKLYQAIAQNTALLARIESGYYASPEQKRMLSDACEDRTERITAILPSGSGFDAGTKLVFADDSRIVFETEFHHMNDGGFYDGWTKHKVTIRASLSLGFITTVSGKNRNDIKCYIADVFSDLMYQNFDWLEGMKP